MAFFNKQTDLVDCVAELKETDYSKQPKLGDIYKRLIKGRKQFEVVMDKDISAVMQISSLDLTLNQQTDEMLSISEEVSDASEIINQASYMGYLFRNRCTSRRELAQYYLYPQSYIPPITLSR
ncbi:MAG: hypothetical protein PUG10_11880 [Lachnospiraceae bacterium]|nr:hypothetical protein [Lachnospiraceae bacterium]